MKSVRSECLSLAVALALPAAALLALPYADILGRTPAADVPAAAPFAAFVTLTDEQEAQAMQRAKFAGPGEASGARVRPVDLILSRLPDDPPASVVRLADRVRPPESPRRALRRTPYLPSRAAPPPAQIAPDPSPERPLGFSKEDLLQID